MNLHLNCCTADQLSAAERQRILELADAHRQADPAFAHWAAGYGVIRHDPLTQLRVRQMVHELVALGRTPDAGTAWQRLAAADRVTSAGMWLVAHMTYSQRVRTDGAALEVDDFKTTPEGHTGGSLNMVPAYAGYLLMDSLDGVTRAWMMGQGHCVAAIDALNVLVGNMTDRHAALRPHRRRAEPVRKRLLCLHPQSGRNAGVAPRLPRQCAHRRGRDGRRLSRLCRAAVRACAAQG
jgi:hypothetical protein